MSFDILWLPMIISAVLFMPLGAFVYSEKGLGNEWLNAIGKTKEDIENSNANMGVLMGGTIIISLVTVALFSIIVSSIGITTVLDLLLLSVIVYAIVLLVRLKNVLFDNNFKLFKVNMIQTCGEFVIIFIVFAFFI